MSTPDPSDAGPVEAPRPPRDMYAWKLVAQTLLGIGGFIGITLFIATHFRPQIEAIGGAFIDRFGLAGVFFGVFCADAFTAPLPPQFFIYSAISRGGSHAAALAVICIASAIGGSVGYRFAAGLSSARLLRPLVARTKPRVEKLFERYGYWGVAIGSLIPLPFSILCYMAGLYRMPPRLFGVLLMFRVPRILFFYAVIRYIVAHPLADGAWRASRRCIDASRDRTAGLPRSPSRGVKTPRHVDTRNERASPDHQAHRQDPLPDGRHRGATRPARGEDSRL